MLKTLTSLPGVSSWEDDVLDFIENEVRPYADVIKRDKMGNLLVFKKGRKHDKTIMFAAHTDEVGFLVSSVTDDGYIKFSSIGIDSRILLGLRVLIGKDKIPGVIGIKAVHLTTAEERKNAVSEKDMYIDIGASSKEESDALVSKGDFIAFDSDFTGFGDVKIKAKALDDRAGCVALIRLIKEADFEYDSWCAFTVQEEVGLRGGRIAAKTVLPDIFIALESTTCSDIPDMEKGLNVTKMGKGVALSYMDGGFMADRKLVNALIKLAEEKNIPCQLKSFASGGNEVRAAQTTGRGVISAALSVPCRYLHSPISVIDKSDYESMYALAKEMCENLSQLEVF